MLVNQIVSIFSFYAIEVSSALGGKVFRFFSIFVFGFVFLLFLGPKNFILKCIQQEWIYPMLLLLLAADAVTVVTVVTVVVLTNYRHRKNHWRNKTNRKPSSNFEWKRHFGRSLCISFWCLLFFSFCWRFLAPKWNDFPYKSKWNCVNLHHAK